MKRKIILISAIVISLGFFAGSVFAADEKTITLKNPLGNVTSFSQIISNITKYISGVIGVLAILMFIIAGILFVISAGEPEKIQRAKKTAIWAAIG